MKFSKETIRLKCRRMYIKVTAELRKNKLKNKKFTIISNNCWGGTIYQSYNLAYDSPTIGLFFCADDYIKFVKNLSYYLNECSLEFIDPNSSKWKEVMNSKSNWGKYPVGKLDDIEIHFLHYNSKEEAKDKWNRRVARVHWDRLIIKFSDQNYCTSEHLKMFAELDYPYKLCFTKQPYPVAFNTIYIKGCEKSDAIKASYEPFGNSRYLNVTELINSLK